MTANSVLEQALQLPPGEREVLCERIWASIGFPDDDDLTKEQAEELRQRIATARANPEDGITWEELKQKWERKWGWKI